MKYKKEYSRAVIEVPETRLNQRLDLPHCEKCKEKLAGYSIEQPNGDVVPLCKECLLIELGQ